jgi:succinoglycan biosynthesis transport protein ExoP
MQMITWREILTTLRSALRWWWVIFFATILASGSAYYFSQDETRYYTTHTTLMIGNSFEKALPDPNQLSLGATLARFYSELAHRERTLRPVQEQLKLPFSWQVIRDGMVSTNVVPSANFLELYITDSNPDRAAAIVNAIADQLMAYSPTSPEKVAAEQKVIDEQLTDSATRIKQIKDKVDEMTTKKQEVESSSDIADINQTLEELNKSQIQEQQSYAALLAYKNGSSVNSLSVFERAVAPTEALPTKRKAIVAFAGIAGMLLSFVTVFVLERIDRRWHSTRDLKDRFSVENLGSIPIGPPLMIASGVAAQERLQAARNVQTNILLAAAEQNTRILMITSPQPSESRTTLAIDLADLFGRAGQRVLIVDADFTSSLLTRMLSQSGADQNWTMVSGNEYQDLWTHLRPTPMANVALLPGRGSSAGEQAMIPSLRWRELVERLLGTADVIIFDGPTTLSGPDAALLAPHVDGVVLTLDPAIDNREDVEKSKTRLLRQKGARLLGAVTFTPSRQRPRLGWSTQQHRPNLPILPASSRTTMSETLENTAFEPPRNEPIVTPPPNFGDAVTVAAFEPTVIDLAPEAEALKIENTPIEASIVIESVVLATAQVGDAEQLSDATMAQPEQPSPVAPAPQPRARRGRSTPKQKPPTKAAGGKPPQG